MHKKLTEQEKARIKEAVKKTEQTTSGEIVTFFVDKSGNYIETALLSGIYTVIAFIILTNILSYYWLLPFKLRIFDFSLYLILTFASIFLISYFIKPIKRILIQKEKKVNTVHSKAVEAFVNEEVFNTKDRTGVLIFISSFEHQVEIITDKGINKFLKSEEKTELISLIIKGIKTKNIADGIVQAIHLYGNLMVKAGFNIKSDDKNELPDDIKTEI